MKKSFNESKMDFKYKQDKVFHRGVVTLELPVDAGTIGCPVHADFIKPVSVLFQKMAEDVDDQQLESMVLPQTITPHALDEFLCAVYKVQRAHGDFPSFQHAMDYKAVLDYFQANARFYEDLDKKLCKGDAFADKLTTLVHLEADRHHLPLAFARYKKLYVKTFMSTGFNCTFFLRREELLQLRRDTLLDLWYASTAAQNMVWSLSTECSKKRKIDVEDRNVRIEEMRKHFDNPALPWVPRFQVETIHDVRLTFSASNLNETITEFFIPSGPTVYMTRSTSGATALFHLSFGTDDSFWYEGKIGACGALTIATRTGTVYEHAIEKWSLVMSELVHLPEEYTACFVGSIRYIKN